MWKLFAGRKDDNKNLLEMRFVSDSKKNLKMKNKNK